MNYVMEAAAYCCHYHCYQTGHMTQAVCNSYRSTNSDRNEMTCE